MDFDYCIKNGLIKINKMAVERIGNSIKIAEKFLNSAAKNFKIQENEMCVLASYNSIFHSSRALLFKKGYIEKSHFCLIIALRHLYKDNTELLDFLGGIDKIRLSRHEIQYRGESASKEESEFVLELADNFLAHVKNSLRVD